jgi:hypothetical protein
MRPVGADDEVYRQFRPVDQRGFDRVIVLAEFCYAGVEAIVGLILGRLIQHVDHVATQDLELRHQTVAIKCRRRHRCSPVSVGLHPGHSALIERACLHLGEQTHPLDHITACTARRPVRAPRFRRR